MVGAMEYEELIRRAFTSAKRYADDYRAYEKHPNEFNRRNEIVTSIIDAINRVKESLIGSSNSADYSEELENCKLLLKSPTKENIESAISRANEVFKNLGLKMR